MDDSSHRRVSVAEAHRLLRDGKAVLVDVRETDEFRAGHAPGALHAPLSRVLPGGRDMILVCRSGNRSRQAVALLAARGIAAVDVIGGMRDWAAQGLPVEDAYGVPGVVI
ncbi:rhodanese-like domain-containing protein [Streptomyces sp. NBC_00124]|uniref:rhodanese-like domain-containing protein n=1 Tax=Streptomyces sp. NBC_00124 TaxID=2975662 RepID=UPI002255DB68|nr:rhodanese-like domain-containing protein [Streptomyces sp. NBC_00124]MCX5365444.1 rhodanese-like domain-containing protein [Streptomyces sp. NBC_00124]